MYILLGHVQKWPDARPLQTNQLACMPVLFPILRLVQA